MSYSSYPELKDSGIEWLGRIPKHWEVKQLKFLADIRFSNVDKKALEGEEPVFLCNYVDVYKNDEITNQLQFMEATASEPEIEAFRLQIGDVLITKDSESPDDIAIPAFVRESMRKLLCGYHLAIIRTSNSSSIQGKYVFYLFSSKAYRAQLESQANGITRFGLSQGVVKDGLTPVPSSIEQQAIAAFLDRKTAELDELIWLKKRQIELLGAKRQALISHAVTRGIDPSVKLRPSGIEWLGEIPAHWELLRLKFCLRSIEQGWSPSCENRMAEPDEWGVLKVGCVNGTSFNQSENKALPSNLEPLIEYEIKDGEVLMSRANTRGLLGGASVVEKVRPRLLLCDKLYRLNLKAGALNNHFLVFSLGASVARHQIERDATGASDSMQNIGQDTVRNLWLPTPPLEEQFVIVDHIRLETSQIDIAVKTIRSQIDQLREYRQALISAAVTGKIDVRGVSV